MAPPAGTSQPAQQTARESLERAFEDYGLQTEGPSGAQTDLQQLGRLSVQDQAELIQAAQEERQRRVKLKKASSQTAAACSEELLKAPAGFAHFTHKMLQFYRQHGIEWPTVVVEYRHLTVRMDALMGSAGVPTVGNVLPQVAKDLFKRKGDQSLEILKDVSGVLKPGVLTLLLGGPGSGKSTLLKVLSGRLKGKNFEASGSVLYNKKPFSEFVVERTAAYVDQNDCHLPVLTVAETIKFAHACAGSRPDFISKKQLQEAYARSMTGGNQAGVPDSPADRPRSPTRSSGGGAADPKPPGALHNKALANASSCGDLAGASSSEGSFSSSMSGGLVQGDDAIMAASGCVHALGEKDLNREEFARLVQLSGSTFKVELVMRLLGLAHARDTMIGNSMMRGVSGGERKRVTSGEALVGNQRVLCMDEISTGLDSATLYSIITFLRQSVGALRTTCVISLLQPPPEVMGLFEELLLLHDGRVIFHGPVSQVQAHFQGVGFELPPRMDVPSWLVEITTPSGQWKYAGTKLRASIAGTPAMTSTASSSSSSSDAPAEPAIPSAAADTPPPLDPASGKPVLLRTAEQLSADFWQHSATGRALMQEVEGGVSLGGSDLHPQALVRSRFALRPGPALRLALGRQWTFFLRNKAFIVFRLLQVIIMGLIVGSLFFGVPADRSGVRTLLGASFICLLFLAFGSAPELGLLMMNRQVWYKVRDSCMLPTYAELTSMAAVRAANTAFETVLFGSIVYWMIGYSVDAGAFFTYLLVVFVTSLSMSGLFRFLGAVAATPVHAQAFGSLGILALILTSGFAIIRPAIPGWWIWVYWLSPFSYALRAIVVNEMTQPRWAAPAPGNPHGLTLGEEGLETFGFYTERYWIWVGVAYVVAFTLLMNSLAFLALKHYSGQQPRASLPDERELLKRRLRAQERQKNASVALTVLKSGASSASPGHHAPTSKSTQQLQPAAGQQQPGESAWTGGAGSSGGSFDPITLVLRDVRYFVPNPATGAGKGRASTQRPASTRSGGGAPTATTAAAAPAAGGSTRSSAGGSSAGGEQQAHDAGVHVKVVAAGAAGPDAGGDKVEAPPAELELLKGISFFATPGNLLALMGGSGAGKTTLLDCAAGRKTVGRITGDILVNGLPKQQSTWARQVGYVEQMDIHSPSTTVEEALWFSGRLRLPPSVSDAQVRARVDEVLAQVDMSERAGDLVGGLPSSARKQLTIAVELMANPPVLFMDEPTSGFDARAAAIVMSVVRTVSSAGHTVVVTIHQPSINIFEAFDSLLLLARGGRMNYFGPLGLHSSALVAYLESVPGTAKLPRGYNPATWMLEVTGGALTTLIPANASIDWPQHYGSSALCLGNLQTADALVEQGTAAAAAAASAAAAHGAHHGGLAGGIGAALRHAGGGGGYAQPFWRQLLECSRKTAATYWKSPSYNLLRLLMTTACGLVYGTMYYKVGRVPSPASIGSVQNVMGVLFSGSNFLGNVNLMSGMPVFAMERVVFYRERAAMMYDPLAIGLATILAELPYVIAQATVFVPIVYWMVGFRADAASFFFYYLMNIASLMMFTSFGFFLVAATPMVELAQLFSSAINFMFNIFNGFTIVESAIPAGWRWANKVVPPTWMIYGLAASQLGDNFSPILGPGLPPGDTVSSYIERVYNYSFGFRWWALLIVASYTLAFTVAAVVFMKHVSWLRR